MLQQLMREMFSSMVEAKDISKVEEYYDPDFMLYTNGQVQDFAAFRAGHERVYPTAHRHLLLGALRRRRLGGER